VFRRRTVGSTVLEVGRIGKRVVVHLDNQQAIVFEPRMTGLVLLAAPPTPEHLRFRLRLRGSAPELLYWDRRGLGSVRLISREELARRYDQAVIGPDALVVTANNLRARLKLSRRAIKVALLDQRAIAGIGNLYASELLHLARIHPATRCCTMRGEQWRRLHAAMQEVLNAAIHHEGSTLADGTYRNALNQSGGYQNHHRVYDRAGHQCTMCGMGEIVRVVQAQRATFFCPKCQRRK
jgi:formamidopyrimidine-DNA glycosylase